MIAGTVNWVGAKAVSECSRVVEKEPVGSGSGWEATGTVFILLGSATSLFPSPGFFLAGGLGGQ